MKARNLLSKYKIMTVRSRYINSVEEAIRFSNGKPVVMKVLSQKALHKSKSGLVKLNLYKPDEIRSAFRYLKNRAQKLSLKSYKILLQEMVPGGVEIIIGGKEDAQFGKLLLLGFGGIYVEAFKDVAVRVCPINEYNAKSMIHQLKSSKIIAPDKKMENIIKTLLLKVSKMLMENNITELDLNPVILQKGKYTAVDLRILK